MSTNNAIQSSSTAGVTGMEEIKRRRRLENLLYTRNRLAVLAAEHRSHRVDDAVELYQLQLETEQVIADEFPDKFEAHVASWAEYEAAAEHHPTATLATCTMCQAVANTTGLNLERPLAA